MSHPNLLPLLYNCSRHKILSLLKCEESALRFSEKLGLIPSPRSVPPHHCGVAMKVSKKRDSSLGWVWECSREKGMKVKGRKMCRAKINPAKGTVLDGLKTPIGDFLAILLHYVMGLGVVETHQELNRWRKEKAVQGNEDILSVDDQPGFSSATICRLFTKFRYFERIILSNSALVIGGLGKTVEIDETFVTRHKYHRGKRTPPMTMTVLGLHCREDKETLFFHVDGKSKCDLWPYISRYVDVETSIICTDQARQYYGIEQIFDDAIHKTTNHSKGEFVDRSDSSNTINSLEGRNKLLKKSLKSRRTPEIVCHYISSFIYRDRYLRKYKGDVGSLFQAFLEHVILIHPPYVNGIVNRPLVFIGEDVPTVESEHIEYAMPAAYRQF